MSLTATVTRLLPHCTPTTVSLFVSHLLSHGVSHTYCLTVCLTHTNSAWVQGFRPILSSTATWTALTQCPRNAQRQWTAGAREWCYQMVRMCRATRMGATCMEVSSASTTSGQRCSLCSQLHLRRVRLCSILSLFVSLCLSVSISLSHKQTLCCLAVG